MAFSNVTARLGLLGPLKSVPSDGIMSMSSRLFVYVRIAQLLLKQCEHTYILVTKTGPFHPTVILWYAAELPHSKCFAHVDHRTPQRRFGKCP